MLQGGALQPVGLTSHRKQVGMRGMQSGNTLIEGAAVAGQNAKNSEKWSETGKSSGERESECNWLGCE